MSKNDLDRSKKELVAELESLRLTQSQVVDRAKQLVSLQTKFQSLLNDADDAIIIFTAEGLIESFNRSAERIFGVSEISVLYRTAERFLPCPKDYGSDVPRFLKENQEQKINQEESPFYAIRGNGEQFPATIVIKEIRPEDLILFNDDGHANAVGDVDGVFLCIVRDVTEQIKVRETLIQAKEVAESASRAKSQFLANISHEIRTPMHGVLGMLALALNHPNADPELKGILEISHHAGENLLDLLNGMLEFSQLDSDGVSLQSIEFNLRYVLDDVAELMSEEAHKKNVDIVTLVCPTVPEVVWGDPTRFRQIIVNLLSNAVKFTNEGRVVVRVTSLGMRDEQSVVRMEVSDTGIGISEDQLDKIFHLFAQADESNTRSKGGSGIGLALTKQLVECIGGRIYVFSRLGQGSTFGFTLPLKPGVQPEVDMSGVTDSRILLADTSIYDYEAMTQYFKSWQVEWDRASGEKQIVDCLLHGIKDRMPFDILLMSCEGILGGREKILHTLASFEELKDLKLILLNTRAGRNSNLEEHIVNAHVPLSKPIRKEVLYECIGSLLEKVERSGDGQVVASEKLKKYGASRNTQVLLVEDNKVNQLVAVGMMKKMGVQIEVANNGVEAVEAVKEKQFDLIFMDCHMPIMDGYEATRDIRSMEKKGQHVPIIALTANCVHDNEAYCLEVGMDDYMQKPFKLHELESTLHRWASVHQGDAPNAS